LIEVHKASLSHQRYATSTTFSYQQPPTAHQQSLPLAGQPNPPAVVTYKTNYPPPSSPNCARCPAISVRFTFTSNNRLRRHPTFYCNLINQFPGPVAREKHTHAGMARSHREGGPHSEISCITTALPAAVPSALISIFAALVPEFVK